MTIKARQWQVLALATAAIGALPLIGRHASMTAGLIAGAAAAGAAALALLGKRLADLERLEQRLTAKEAQYDAAYTTLSAQRERLTLEMEAEMSNRSQAQLLEERMAGYREGAIDALQGRLLADEPKGPSAANVIPLEPRRQSREEPAH